MKASEMIEIRKHIWAGSNQKQEKPKRNYAYEKPLDKEMEEAVLNKSRAFIDYTKLYLEYSNSDSPYGNAYKAIKYLKMGAEARDNLSMRILAKAYKQGALLPKDELLAFKLMQDAVKDKKDSHTLTDLSEFYLDGVGTEADYRKAHDLLLQACELEKTEPQSYGSAAVVLHTFNKVSLSLAAEGYAEGNEKYPCNKKVALDIYRLMSELNTDDSPDYWKNELMHEEMGKQIDQEIISGIEELERQLQNPAEVERIEKEINEKRRIDYVLSVDELIEEAENDNIRAQQNLFEIYLYAYRGLQQDIEKAIYWGERAVDPYLNKYSIDKEQDQRIMYRLFYEYAHGDFNNPQRGYHLLVQAANAEHSCDQLTLGIICFEGDAENGLAPDYEKAIYWLEKASMPEAYYYLGRIYWEGKGRPLDYKTAYDYFMLASQEWRNADLLMSLGICYERGAGVAADISEAIKYYKESAENGNEHANARLEFLLSQPH